MLDDYVALFWALCTQSENLDVKMVYRDNEWFIMRHYYEKTLSLPEFILDVTKLLAGTQLEKELKRFGIQYPRILSLFRRIFLMPVWFHLSV